MRHKKKNLNLPQGDFRNRKIAVITFISLIFIGIFFGVRQTAWNGISRITLILQDRYLTEVDQTFPLAIFSIEPKYSSAIYVLLPGNTLLDVPYGYKGYTAATVYKLGELDNKRGGGRLLQKSIESTFGVSIDGHFINNKGRFPFIITSKDGIKEIKQSFFSIIGIILKPLDIYNIIQNSSSNLSFFEKIRLFMAVRRIRLDQITYSNLVDSDILDDEVLPDNSVIKIVNKDLFDLKIAGYFQDTLIRNEDITLEVSNAAGIELVASQFARILTHMGANVVAKTTSDQEMSGTCYLYLQDETFKASAVVKKLNYLYNCRYLQNFPQSPVADIMVVLGRDFIR